MQLVSVLCLPVSSIPTSLSFFKSFCPCYCTVVAIGGSPDLTQLRHAIAEELRKIWCMALLISSLKEVS